MLGKRLINTKVAGGGGGCTDIVDNYDPFGGNGVALYQLNGNATDVSGNYDGTASNVTYGTGVFGQAGVFNGSSSKITTSLTQTNTNAWSWSFWVNINAKPSAGYIAAILSNINGAAPFAGVTFLIDSPNFGIASNGSNIWTTNTINPSLSTWYHIVITYNGSGAITPYINGQSYGVISHTPSNGNTITLGDSDVSSWGSFNGSIDQVRIFNTALTPLEVEALYTEELCICDGTVDTLDILGDGSCIATYQLDGNANDLSGNYSGTTTNVSYGVGEFDLAGVFNGSSSRITTVSSQLPIPASGAFTVSFWAKVDSSLTLYNTCMLSFGDFWLKSEYLTGRFGLGDINVGYETTTSMGYGWNHCVLTVDASNNINLYLNGANEFTGNKSISRTNGGNFAIGVARLSNPVYYYNGELDQVRIFNKALSAGEVTTLYNETACTKVTRTAGDTQILGDSSCIAYYKLDGNANDETGNYNGTFTNPNYGNGEFLYAGMFNGSSSYIITQRSSAFNIQDFTTSAWIYTTTSGSYQVINSTYEGSPNPDRAWTFRLTNSNNLEFSFTQTNGSNINYTTTEVLSQNTWYHVVASKTSSSVALYINGSQVLTSSASGVLYFSSTPTLGIGRLNQLGVQYFNGSIDQVRIFNKAVTPSEVTTLYNEGI